MIPAVMLSLLTLLLLAPTAPTAAKRRPSPPPPVEEEAPAPLMGFQRNPGRTIWDPRPEDLKWLNSVVASHLAEMRAARCQHPVLRGEALTGDPTQEYLDLFGYGPGPKEQCRMATMASKVRPGGDPLFPADVLDTAPAAQACLESAATLQRLTRYSSSCTPFRLGIMPAQDLPGLDVLLAGLGILHRHQVANGQYQEALELGLDLALFSQSMAKGWVTLRQASVASQHWLDYAYPNLGQMLDDGVLTRQQLQQLVTETGLLIAAEPSPASLLVADRMDMLHMAFLPEFFGLDWTPPRALPAPIVAAPPGDRPPSRPRPPTPPLPGPSSVIFVYLAITAASADLIQHCEAASTDLDCLAHFNRMIVTEQALAAESSQFFRLFKSLRAFGLARGLPFFLLTQDSKPWGFPLQAVLYGYLSQRTMLRFLRVHAAFLLHELDQGVLPDQVTLLSPPWTELLADGTFGGKILVTFQGPKVLLSVARLPDDLPDRLKPDFRYEWTIKERGPTP